MSLCDIVNTHIIIKVVKFFSKISCFLVAYIVRFINSGYTEIFRFNYIEHANHVFVEYVNFVTK